MGTSFWSEGGLTMNFLARVLHSTPTLVKRFCVSLLLVAGLLLINKGVTGKWKPEVKYVVDILTPSFDFSQENGKN